MATLSCLATQHGTLCPSKPCCVQIRSQLANEMIDDLKNIAEENALLMRESLTFAFSLDTTTVDHPLSRKSEAD